MLRPASEIPARGVDLAAWVDALLAEYTAAHDSARRCHTYALKPTTSGREMGVQTDLRNTHLIRMERVKMALTEALGESMKPASDESKCDTLIREMDGAVIQFGRKGKRTPNTHGIPDRLYFVQNRMVWFEVKSANDYLSAAQIVFLHLANMSGGIVGCGNRDDLCTLLNAPNAHKVGAAQITKYSTRQQAKRAPALLTPHDPYPPSRSVPSAPSAQATRLNPQTMPGPTTRPPASPNGK